jgi:hypothetical protein
MYALGYFNHVPINSTRTAPPLVTAGSAGGLSAGIFATLWPCLRARAANRPESGSRLSSVRSLTERANAQPLPEIPRESHCTAAVPFTLVPTAVGFLHGVCRRPGRTSYRPATDRPTCFIRPACATWLPCFVTTAQRPTAWRSKTVTAPRNLRVAICRTDGDCGAVSTEARVSRRSSALWIHDARFQRALLRRRRHELPLILQVSPPAGFHPGDTPQGGRVPASGRLDGCFRPGPRRGTRTPCL